MSEAPESNETAAKLTRAEKEEIFRSSIETARTMAKELGLDAPEPAADPFEDIQAPKPVGECHSAADSDVVKKAFHTLHAATVEASAAETAVAAIEFAAKKLGVIL